jgi:omega-6 fatty acid desaturase (delta-12 desaturase)
MYASLRVSYLLVLLLAIPTAGFLLRTYIIFHDCTHGSFFRSPRANALLGGVIGLMVFTPFAKWRHDHVVHHATAGNLDRRGIGDVPTMTLDEYNDLPPRGRFWYRLTRHPVAMFGIGPVYSMLIMQRKIDPWDRPRAQQSVRRTNVALVVIVAALCWLIGWRDFVLIETPLIVLGGGAGIWLFYVQHQFEQTSWHRSADWTYTDAALSGSSFLALPGLLRFFTGNIGYHHIHHLLPRIPGYRLHRAYRQDELLPSGPKLSFCDGLRAIRLKLWDEDNARLVTWAQRRRMLGATVGRG